VEAQVDAGSACVRLGDESWPFELDCREASALVEIDGRAVRVRPLRWREKLSLARFAHLGTTFVEGQQLRIALEGAPMPTIEEERAVLSALAAWVAAPSDEPVPFQTRALAGVTLDVCRAVGLKPADLDARDAYEVEALWRVGTGGTEHGRLAVNGTGGGRPGTTSQAAETWESQLTRIEIVPDGVSRAEPAQPEAETASTTVVDAPPDETAAPPSMAVPPVPRRRPRELAAVRDFAVLTREPPPAAPAEQPDSVAATPEEPVPGSTRAVAVHESAPEASTRAAVADPTLEQSPPGRLSARWRPDALRRAQPDDGTASSSATRPRRARASRVEEDAEQLFDELADGLERAASALGVDLEA
jgi:hypothetical protein